MHSLPLAPHKGVGSVPHALSRARHASVKCWKVAVRRRHNAGLLGTCAKLYDAGPCADCRSSFSWLLAAALGRPRRQPRAFPISLPDVPPDRRKAASSPGRIPPCTRWIRRRSLTVRDRRSTSIASGRAPASVNSARSSSCRRAADNIAAATGSERTSLGRSFRGRPATSATGFPTGVAKRATHPRPTASRLPPSPSPRPRRASSRSAGPERSSS